MARIIFLALTLFCLKSFADDHCRTGVSTLKSLDESCEYKFRSYPCEVTRTVTICRERSFPFFTPVEKLKINGCENPCLAGTTQESYLCHAYLIILYSRNSTTPPHIQSYLNEVTPDYECENPYFTKSTYN